MAPQHTLSLPLHVASHVFVAVHGSGGAGQMARPRRQGLGRPQAAFEWGVCTQSPINAQRPASIDSAPWSLCGGTQHARLGLSRRHVVRPQPNLRRRCCTVRRAKLANCARIRGCQAAGACPTTFSHTHVIMQHACRFECVTHHSLLSVVWSIVDSMPHACRMAFSVSPPRHSTPAHVALWGGRRSHHRPFGNPIHAPPRVFFAPGCTNHCAVRLVPPQLQSLLLSHVPPNLHNPARCKPVQGGPPLDWQPVLLLLAVGE
jgi:hypothetical protein